MSGNLPYYSQPGLQSGWRIARLRGSSRTGPTCLPRRITSSSNSAHAKLLMTSWIFAHCVRKYCMYGGLAAVVGYPTAAGGNLQFTVTAGRARRPWKEALDFGESGTIGKLFEET
ncbi:unnamed protein product [Calypogeia fissa]